MTIELSPKVMRRIYNRINQLIEKYKSGTNNLATYPAFMIGFEADLDDLIKEQRND